MTEISKIYKKIEEKLDGMPIQIAICNDKGGSAKTTTAINLAEAYAKMDFDTEGNKKLKVLLIDGDDSRTCTMWALRGNQTNSKKHFIVCNEKEAVKVIIKERPNLIIYDTAGGIATKEISELSEICQYFVLPCKPDYFNSVGTFIMANWLIEKNKKYGILLSDTPTHGNYARGNEIKFLLESEGKKYFKNFIKRSAKVVDANDNGKTVFEMTGIREIQDSFENVAIEILKQIESDERLPTNINFSDLETKEIDEAISTTLKFTTKV